jgi:hypothetical protein
VREAEGSLGYVHSDSGHDPLSLLNVLHAEALFIQSIKLAIIQFLMPACDIIAEREAKERSEDHQLPSPATWARQVPLGSMVLRSFPHQACPLELSEGPKTNFLLKVALLKWGSNVFV